jgi:transcription elongation factor GreA
MASSQLSQQAYDRLQEELAERSGPRRKDISAWIERAREHGDIRENADYDAAKNEQGHNEARIRQLEEILRTAEVVAGTSGDVVAPGTIVEVKMEGDDDTVSYLVGSIEERSDEFEVLSTSSPLGQALLDHRPGETVSYDGPRRTFAVEIVSVRPVG